MDPTARQLEPGVAVRGRITAGGLKRPGRTADSHHGLHLQHCIRTRLDPYLFEGRNPPWDRPPHDFTVRRRPARHAKLEEFMFARVSTYRPGPGSTGAPTAATVEQVLEMPGCRGIYYLLGKDSKSLSITLWDDEDALSASQKAAARLRTETSAAQDMQILDVEAFEVLTADVRH
jgi:heme-degrading monooxygenase HmoA